MDMVGKIISSNSLVNLSEFRMNEMLGERRLRVLGACVGVGAHGVDIKTTLNSRFPTNSSLPFYSDWLSSFKFHQLICQVSKSIDLSFEN